MASGVSIPTSDSNMDFKHHAGPLATTTLASGSSSIGGCHTASNSAMTCRHRVSVFSPRFCFLLDLIKATSVANIATRCEHCKASDIPHRAASDGNERGPSIDSTESERSSGSSDLRDMLLADLRRELNSGRSDQPIHRCTNTPQHFGGYIGMSTGRPGAIGGR